jgi:hypothetical protein
VATQRVPNSLKMSVAERSRKRVGWSSPSENVLDRATAMFPRLMYERLDDLCIDFSVGYPTAGLSFHVPGRGEGRPLGEADRTADVLTQARLTRIALSVCLAVGTSLSRAAAQLLPTCGAVSAARGGGTPRTSATHPGRPPARLARSTTDPRKLSLLGRNPRQWRDCHRADR